MPTIDNEFERLTWINLGVSNTPKWFLDTNYGDMLMSSSLTMQEHLSLRKRYRNIVDMNNMAFVRANRNMSYGRNDQEAQIVKDITSEHLQIVYRCNEFTYFNFWLQREMYEPFKLLYHPDTISYKYFVSNSRKPDPQKKCTFDRGCGGISYNIIGCLIQLAEDAEENTLFTNYSIHSSNDESRSVSNFASCASVALNVYIHDTYIGRLGIKAVDCGDTINSGYKFVILHDCDEKKKQLIAKLEELCKRKHLYFDFENYGKVVVSETKSEPYAEDIIPKFEWSHCLIDEPCQAYQEKHRRPLSKHCEVVDITRMFADGHTEVEHKVKEMKYEKIREVERFMTEHAKRFDDWYDQYWIVYEVRYIDGFIGLVIEHINEYQYKQPNV